jgi:hypothetical protein
MYPEGRGKTSLGTPARDLLAPPLKTKSEGGNMSAEQVVCTAQEFDQQDCTELATVSLRIDSERVPACPAHAEFWMDWRAKDGQPRDPQPLS